MAEDSKKQLIPCIWIAWERHRRTIELARALGIKLYIFHYNLPRIVKYPMLILKTLLLVNYIKPKLIIVQNPSIILTLLCCILKKLYKFKLVVDAHNAGLSPEIPILKAMRFLYTYYQRQADLVIVTNKSLSETVLRVGGIAVVLPDKIPTPPLKSGKCFTFTDTKYKVVFVCSFGKDEPYQQILDAARLLIDTDITFYITGNHAKVSINRNMLPQNVILTGFIEDEEYWDLLRNCDLVIDLTLREDCLVCGAYEAVAVATPMLLSDKKVLRDQFYKGAIFVKNEAKSIAEGIALALEKRNNLKKEVRELRRELDKKWQEQRQELVNMLYGSTFPKRL